MTTTTPPEPDVRALAHEVAALFGPAWSVHPDDDWSRAWVLHHQDGRRVRLYGPAYGNAGRLHAEGLLPNTDDDERPDRTGLDAGNISMADTSPARRVATEITRRLLPKLDIASAEYARRLEELRAAERARVAAARCLAALPGMSEPKRTHHDRRLTAYHLSWDGEKRGKSHWLKPQARVEADADRETAAPYVNVNLSGLTPDQAERVLHALIDETSATDTPDAPGDLARYRVVARRTDDTHPGASTLTHFAHARSIEEAVAKVRGAHERPGGVYGDQDLYRVAEVTEEGPSDSRA